MLLVLCLLYAPQTVTEGHLELQVALHHAERKHLVCCADITSTLLLLLSTIAVTGVLCGEYCGQQC
jgi:hypothetical protein